MARPLRRAALAPTSDPVAEVWRSSELLGCVAPFLDPNEAAWSFILGNKAAAAAAYGGTGQLVSRTVSRSWALDSGLLASLEGRIHARAMCYRLTRKQRVDFLCHCVASGCSQESLEGAVVAAGFSPPPLEVLIAAASAGRLAVCRWLVEVLGCPGLLRLPCLCLITAARPGAAVVEEVRAWLTPAALGECSKELEARAASGDIRAVAPHAYIALAGHDSVHCYSWGSALDRARGQRDCEQPDGTSWSALARNIEFYRGPHAALAVPRLTQMEQEELRPCVVYNAAEARHAEAVRFLLSRGVEPSFGRPAEGAARGGHVGVMQALHEAGGMGEPARCFREALEGGSLPVVEWLLCTFELQTVGVGRLTLRHAAQSGNVDLLKALPRLLPAAGPGWDMRSSILLEGVAASGCEAAVEWLAAEAGAVGQDRYSSGYRKAVDKGDLRMVQRLRKLGCPYDKWATEALAEAAARMTPSAAALPWLAEPGCPTSWGGAAAEARAEEQAAARAEDSSCLL